MSVLDEFTFHPESFSGEVRLFPLPNLVLFPHVLQPLHIREPQYKELLSEALAGDRLIAVTQWDPRRDFDPFACGQSHPVGCLGGVVADHRLPNGSWNLLLIGLMRMRLVEEIPSDASFRRAKVELLDDCYRPEQSADRAALGRKLRAALLDALCEQIDAEDQWDRILAGDVPLGVLTDIVSYVLDITTRQKLALLAESDVDRRARWLLAHLTHLRNLEAYRGPEAFPGGFSNN